ncbi:MAG: sugar ABC transporter substrate-binding protein [Tissierellia bacterium]|jgi:arabinogalactan oligomer/maltooligosaccharide transport system substrate-binding protein|nr:sugar ABC transporter substrate-binding protein [Tissierellia bacterium]
MKNVRKVLALLLVLTLVFTACGQKGTAPEAKPAETAEGGLTGEISVQAETEWMEYYEAAAERVKAANPDAVINIIEVGAFDHLDTMDNTDALNEDVADLFAIPADRLYGLNDALVLNPIDAEALAADLGGWDDYNAGLGGQFNIDGEYLAFPYNIETLITYANKENAEAAGIDLANPVEISNQDSEARVLLPLFDAWFGVAVTNAVDIEFLGINENGEFYSDMTKEYSELTADQQAAIQTIYDYWSAHNSANTSLFDNEAGWGYVDDEFRTGSNGVIRLGGPWEQGTMTEIAGEDNLAINSIDKITINGNPLSHWKGGWGLAINSRIEEDQDKINLAYAMIKEIVNPEYAVDLFNATGKILENATIETYENSDLSDIQKEIIAAVYDSYEKAPARPLFSEWGQVWDTWKNALLSWNSVQPKTVEEGYNEIKASFDAMMMNIK